MCVCVCMSMRTCVRVCGCLWSVLLRSCTDMRAPLACSAVPLQLLFLISGIMSTRIVDALIATEVYPQARLDDPTTDAFQLWSDPTRNGLPVNMQVAIWDLQNKDAFMKGAKPEFELVGPFTFAERRLKHSFNWTDGGSVVWYKENMTYHLVDNVCPEGTGPLDFHLKCTISPSTKISTINVPLMAAIALLEYDLPRPHF